MDSANIESLRDGISVVVPVYNSEGSLTPLVERLVAVLPSSAAEWEILLINDGSLDRSWEVIRALAARYPRVLGIRMLRNFGQHNALLAGTRIARFTVTITMDDDLQHQPARTSCTARPTPFLTASGATSSPGLRSEPSAS